MRALILSIVFVASVGLASNEKQEIHCWGNDAELQDEVPTDVASNKIDSEVEVVQLGETYTCTLSSKKTLNCWGRKPPPGLVNYKNVYSFATAETYYIFCISTKSGVMCNQLENGPVLSPSAVMEVNNHFGCALDLGHVFCWGSSPSLPEFKNPKKILVVGNGLIVLDDSGIQYFSYDNVDYRTDQKFEKPTDIFKGYEFACGVTKDSTQCWGPHPPVQKILASEASHLFAVGTEICSLDNQMVRCWGVNSSETQKKISSLSNPRKVFASSNSLNFCAIDDSGFSCKGTDKYGETSLPLFDTVAAGFGNSCVVSGGVMQCWGNGSAAINRGIFATSDNSVKTGGIFQINMGQTFACALSFNYFSDHACWGDDLKLIEKSPGLPFFPFASESLGIVAAGYSHACFFSDPDHGGGSFCIGQDDFGETKLPAGLRLEFPEQTGISSKSVVSVGGHHTCAIDRNSGVICWGQNKLGQIEPPKNLKNPREIAAGFSHSCVIADDGVHCWGSNAFGQLKVPALKNPRVLRAGGYHTCAIDDEGAHCWGDNSFGQASVPKDLVKNILQLSTGYLHNCAITK